MPRSTTAITAAILAISGLTKPPTADLPVATDHDQTTPVRLAPDVQPDQAGSALGGNDGHRAPAGPHSERPSTPPDDVAEYAGGTAARVRDASGTAVDGDLFLLMAVAGSAADARLYDATPFTHENEVPSETLESNNAAVATAATIAGVDVELLEFTTAPGGGPSGGITYTIAYLNLLTDGAFTDDLRIAATGRMGRHGYIDPINAIAEKTAAAHLADADVLFTAVVPNAEVSETHASRAVGEMFRARNTPAPLAEERRWTRYHTWGATRPTDGMDIVGVRHIGDVAAYLCGTGSETACTTLDHVADAYDAPPGTATPASDGPTGLTRGPSLPVR